MDLNIEFTDIQGAYEYLVEMCPPYGINHKTLQDILSEEYGWELRGAQIIEFHWSNPHLEIFEELAHFIKKGSYIQCVGEGCQIEEWYFDGDLCYYLPVEWPADKRRKWDSLNFKKLFT